jgi:hypothetical protein
VAAAAPAALDRISHGVDFRHHPIETALNWVAAYTLLALISRAREAGADTPSSVSRPTRDQSDPLAPPGRLLADVATSF